MDAYDLLVLGGGTGNVVASEAAERGLDVALVERDGLGGTCLNRGCNPSKKLIHRADVVRTVESAADLGVDARVDGVAYADVVEDVVSTVEGEAARKAERAREHEHISLYAGEGRFVDERTVAVETNTGETRVTGERVVLAGGSRPTVPESIDGTDEVSFMTSDEALRRTDRPDRLVVVGGGYIAVEMAHFFDAMGADVAVVGSGDVLLDREDRAVAERLTEVYAERHDLHLGYRATALATDGDDRVVTAEAEDGDTVTVRGDAVLLATGRRPNTDTWDVATAGIDTDEEGFVRTDDALETSVDGVFAIGDIAGNYMLKHSGDHEAECVVETLTGEGRRPATYPGMAHAVFGSPQVASLGETEADLDGVEYGTATYRYDETALGGTLDHDGGFAKAVVGPDAEVLGCHVVGPHASTLVHEVSTAVAAGGDAEDVATAIHAHPALSEVVQGAFRRALDAELSGI
jgi:dihydrolipoamide dehydrogenase